MKIPPHKGLVNLLMADRYIIEKRKGTKHCYPESGRAHQDMTFATTVPPHNVGMHLKVSEMEFRENFLKEQYQDGPT